MEEATFQITQFVLRPDIGDEGSNIRVRTNFFEVTNMQDTNISHYDVTITPTVPKRLNWKVFNRFVEQYREEALGGARPVFDGMYSITKEKKK
jgi:eukaryotic translation initiation factor 2C